MIKFRFLTTIGLSLLITSLGVLKPVAAEQWVYIGTADNGDAHFLDFDTIRGSGNMRNFWVRVEDSNGRAVALNKLIVDCVRREGDLLEEIRYSRYGGGYPSRNENPYPRMRELAPGTMFAAYANFLCSRITTNTAPAPTVQPSVTAAVRASCGDPAPSRSGSYRLYPVYVNYSQRTLQSIHASLCRDAFRTTRENGRDSIQVASFTDESRARTFAQTLRNRFGSGEVGLPSTIVRP